MVGRVLVTVLTTMLCVLLFSVQTVMAQAAEKAEYTRYVNYPQVNYGYGAQAKRVKRGEYLVKIGDCAACHTSLEPGSKTFSGGLGIKTPFGTFYTPNITPDKATGIGSWTDEQFITTMHRGVAPGFRFLFPVFPYLYYSRVKKADLLAIKAYLFSLDPVHAPNKAHDVPFPLNVRFLQLGWRVLFFYFQNQGEYQDDPQQSAEWNRGAYLVQGLGHCGMCHTPLNFLGAPKSKYFLRGTLVDGYYAPDITADGIIKAATMEQVVTSLHTGNHFSGKGIIHGPMEEVEHNSLRYLKQADLQAIVTYLKGVHSAQLNKPASKQAGDHPGAATYANHCAVCHDTGAAGAPKLGDVEDWAPRIKQGETLLVQRAIDGYNAMPAKGNCMSCSDTEIKDVVQYMIEHAHGDGSSHDAGKGKPPAATSFERGKKIYQMHCATCHANGAAKTDDKTAWNKRLQQKGMQVLIHNVMHGVAGHPLRGQCKSCTDGDLVAAVKYMVKQSGAAGDYHLW